MRAFYPVLLVLCIAACADDGGSATGEEGGPCYPNSTCAHVGLTCASKVCVYLPDAAAPDAKSDLGAPDQRPDAARDSTADGAHSDIPSDTSTELLVDAAPDLGPDAATFSCPTLPGPSLVKVPSPGGGYYCIDSTEVTKGQYQSFLATAPSTANQPTVCSWNTTFLPSADWPPAAGGLSQPVGWVDWCDARAYCAAVGKRLCGKFGGGPNAFQDLNDPTKSQWFAACSSYAAGAHAYAYPYGDSYFPAACNGNDNGASFDILDVGTQPACQSSQPGFGGIFDMSGNVSEWVDSCDGATGAADKCHHRGGATNAPELWVRCDTNASTARDFKNDLVGFRCCYP